MIIGFSIHGQQNESKISTVEFIQIVDSNKEEAIFYYQNNWRTLREMAIKKGYIDSFGFFENQATRQEPFHFILVTTFKNKGQFDLVEEHFSELIKEHGDLKLMNEKKPGEFRKTLYSKRMTKY